MALIYWMPEYTTGIEIIDQQHRLLVDLINELHDAHNNAGDRQTLLKILNKIGMLSASHFAREEHLFETHGYPDTEDHLEEHAYFEDMLFQFEDEFKAGNQEITTSVLSFFSEWLVDHINGSDKRYVPFLKKRGV
ncbi:MAG: bacteriohemerythrin [Desulfopila sp.]